MSVQPDSTVPVNAVEINIDHFSLVAFRQFEVFPVPPHSTGQRTASGSCRVIERKIRLDAPVVRQVQDSSSVSGADALACFSVRAKRHSLLKDILSRPFSRVAHAVRNRQTKANTDSLIRVQLTRLYYTKVIQKRLKNEGRTYKIKGYIVIISYICRDEPGLFIFKKER